MAYLWVLLSSRTMAPSRKTSRLFKWHMTIVDSTVTPSSSTDLPGNYGLISTTIPTNNGLTRVSGHQVSPLIKCKLRVIDRLFLGNAWAALGMSRVANTIKKSSFANEMTPQMNDLNAWTKEILDGVFAALVSFIPKTSCLRYTDNTNLDRTRTTSSPTTFKAGQLSAIAPLRPL